MSRGRPDWLLRLAVLISAGVLLGPALSSGLVQKHDLGWSPDPRLTPTVMGWYADAPRVVPSDAFGVLLGSLLGAGVAQKLVLVVVLVVVGLGALSLVHELRPRAGSAGRLLALLLVQWNPYVVERLALGQWTVLWGYAAVPWGLLLAVRARRADSPVALPLIAVTASCAIGGSNSLVVLLTAVTPALIWGAPRWRALLATWCTAILCGAAWWWPALVSSPQSSAAGAAAFAPRADSPVGTVLSLVGGGGIWNQAVVPAERASVLLGVLSALLFVTGVGVLGGYLGRRGRALPAAALLGLALPVMSATPGLDEAWRVVVTALPGGGLLRDSQKLLAAWVVVGSVGVGLGLDLLRRQVDSLRRPLTVLAVLPPLLLPSAAWGSGGDLDAVSVPTQMRDAATQLSAAPPGWVGVLPWNQYRRYSWNDYRVSLGLTPRMVNQPVLHDDSLPLRDQVIPGESALAAQVSRAIADGVPPVDALRAVGVRYVLVEHGSAGPQSGSEQPRGRVLAHGSHVTVVDVGGTRSVARPHSSAHRGGWLISLAGIGAGVLVPAAVRLVGVCRRRRHAS